MSWEYKRLKKDEVWRKGRRIKEGLNITKFCEYQKETKVELNYLKFICHNKTSELYEQECPYKMKDLRLKKDKPYHRTYDVITKDNKCKIRIISGLEEKIRLTKKIEFDEQWIGTFTPKKFDSSFMDGK